MTPAGDDVGGGPGPATAEGGWNPYASPDAPPGTAWADEQPRAVPEPVPFWPRAGARIIDTIVSAGVGFVGASVASVLLAALKQWGAFEPAHRLGRFSLISLFLNMLGTLAYHAVSESVGGASIGKAVLGLRVCRTDGTACSLGAAIVRNIGYYIDGFFFGAVAYSVMSKSPLRQRLGDQWAKTAVFRAASVPARGAAGRVALGIVLGLVLWVTQAFLTTLGKALGM